MSQTDDDQIDWSKTTFEGAEREQLRRWSQLSLREIVQSLEDMEQLAVCLGNTEALPPQRPARET